MVNLLPFFIVLRNLKTKPESKPSGLPDSNFIMDKSKASGSTRTADLKVFLFVLCTCVCMLMASGAPRRFYF